jgi:hypothetical protein
MPDHDTQHEPSSAIHGDPPNGTYLFEGVITHDGTVIFCDLADVIVHENHCQFFGLVTLPLDACEGAFYRKDVVLNDKEREGITIALIEYAARHAEDDKARALLEIFRSFVEMWEEGEKHRSEYEEVARTTSDKEDAWLN